MCVCVFQYSQPFVLASFVLVYWEYCQVLQGLIFSDSNELIVLETISTQMCQNLTHM